MTFEEAIKYIERAKEQTGWGDPPETLEAFDMAIDALKGLQSYYDAFVDFKNIERGYECQWISDANLGKK